MALPLNTCFHAENGALAANFPESAAIEFCPASAHSSIDIKLKSTVVAALLTASMEVPAFANEAVVAPPPKFTAHDAQALFEQDAKPMQLAAMSQQEMRETEGRG